MEQLFMQVFERRDWVAAQVQQQADSYAQTLACSLLAAGHRPPDWLLPSRFGGPQQELNGKPIVPGLVFFSGSQITTPAANRNFFLPPAIPNTLIRKLEVSKAYTEPVNDCAALSTLAVLDDDQHEELQQAQTSLSKELSNTCAEANMFSRIQRSKSSQKNIEDQRCGSDQAADSGSCDDVIDGMNRSNHGSAGLNRTTVPSSSRSCRDVANNAETTSSCPGKVNDFYATQGRSTDFLKCHDNLGSQGNQLDCLSSLAFEDKLMCSGYKSSARDPQIVPLPENSELNIEDTMCHAMPVTHLLVEPKNLQFDGIESVCMDTINEQTGQQQESALESDRFGVADQNILSEDPYPANSSQENHSLDRSSLDGLKSDCVKSANADLNHKQYGLKSGHRDLSALHSLDEEPSLNTPTEIPGLVGDPLLRNTILYVPETSSRLNKIQETGLLNANETELSETSRSLVNPLLERDTSQTLEELESSNPKVSSPLSSGSLKLPTQLADTSFEANASSGTLMKNVLGDGSHNHLSNLLTNGTNSRCSVGMSSVSVVQIPPQILSSDNVCQSNPLSYETHSINTYSNGFLAVDAFDSIENLLPQDQYILARSSLKFDGDIVHPDAPLGHAPTDMHSETLGNLTSELVNCHSGKLDDGLHVNEAHDSFIENKMDQIVAQKVVFSVSSGRTRKVHKTEKSRMTHSAKCDGTLQQEGREQQTPSVGNVPKNTEACTVENVEHMKFSWPTMQYCLRSSVSYEKNNQLQAERGDGRKRSDADGVQLNGGTSSKRKRIKRQDVTSFHSSRRNSLSLNHQDDIGSNAVTAENLSGRSRPSGRYLLRSSGFNDFMSLKSKTKYASSNSKVSIAIDGPETLDPSPNKIIKNSHLSSAAICGSSREEALPHSFDCSNCGRSAIEGMDLLNSQAQFQTNFNILATSVLPSYSNIAHNIRECSAQENHCSEGVGLNVNISSVQHQEMAIQTDENMILVNHENFEKRTELGISSGTGSLDQHGKRTSSDLIAPDHKKLILDSGVKFDSRCESEDPAKFLLSDATVPRLEGDESANCNNILPEFECFDVSLPLDNPTTEKGAYITDISNKVNSLSGGHQLVATMSKKATKATNCSFSGDVSQYSVRSDDSIADTSVSCGLGIISSFLPSDIIATCSSNDSDKNVIGENPLTPAVEKYSLGKLSARVGSTSEHMGSIPELSCFRIDEDSGIAEENECQDMLPGSEGNQIQCGRKALQDITGLCQNTENSALDSLGFRDTANIELTTVARKSNLNQNSGLKNDYNNKKPKGTSASLVNREGKVSQSLNRLSKTEVTDKRNQRNTSETNLGKRSKPSNIVANVASFIPLVKLKPSTTACVKKDVRVKALEAAEAAKRLEEKKQIEREMRKEAAKLEREKMKKEKESKQKQEQEQKKKRDTDMAARKRQRDEEEKREKERKRRCAEEARKQQKQPTERRHASDEKEDHPKASDNTELRENLVEVAKSKVKPDERIELGNKATTSNNDITVDERPANFGSHATENIQNSLHESYVMTPYKDSADEDDDEEASRRRKKLKPSWVREENLVKTLLSYSQALDPREIFAQKCSFNLSDVLSIHVPLRGSK